MTIMMNSNARPDYDESEDDDSDTGEGFTEDTWLDAFRKKMKLTMPDHCVSDSGHVMLNSQQAARRAGLFNASKVVSKPEKQKPDAKRPWAHNSTEKLEEASFHTLKNA